MTCSLIGWELHLLFTFSQKTFHEKKLLKRLKFGQMTWLAAASTKLSSFQGNVNNKYDAQQTKEHFIFSKY